VWLINGQFAVESAPGKGTTVCVEIPLEAAPPRRSPSG
jgi:signal transduction histidine kinase